MNYIKEKYLQEYPAQRLLRVPDKWRDNYNGNLLAGHFKLGKPMSELIDRCDKPTVLLVAASPHLNNNVDNIIPYQDKLTIIACDVTFPLLCEKGIRPAVVVATDYNEILARSFRGYDSTGVSLVCASTVHPDVIRSWQGDVYYFNMSDTIRFKDKFLRELTRGNKFPYVLNRDFVGATAYQIAQLFEPYHILLAGYGFAFVDGHIYCDGVFRARGREEFTVPAHTSKALIMYLRMFYKLTAEDDRIKNCTEGGIYNKNNMKLSEALEIYCGR